MKYGISCKAYKLKYDILQEEAKNSIPANALLDIGEFSNRQLGTDKIFTIMQNLNKKQN